MSSFRFNSVYDLPTLDEAINIHVHDPQVPARFANSSDSSDFGSDVSGSESDDLVRQALQGPRTYRHLTVIPTTMPPAELQPSLSDLLSTIHCVYLTQLNVLYCSSCNVMLHKNFQVHFRKEHCEKVNVFLARKIKRECFASSSVYIEYNNSILERLPFLPVLPGFRCSGCTKLFEIEKNAKSHLKACTSNGGIIPCLLQNTSNCAAKRYIQVIPRPGEMQETEALEPAMVELLDNAASPIYNIEDLDEEPHQVSVFYQDMNWRCGPQRPDAFDAYPAHIILKLPSNTPEEAEDYTLQALLKSILFNSINEARNGLELFRYSIMELAGENRRFTGISKASAAEYTTLWIRYFFFLRYFIQNPSPTIPIAHEITTAVNAFLEQRTSQNLFSVFLLATKEDACEGRSCSATFVTFLHMLTAAEEDTLMSAERVGRTCTQLAYLMRLTVIQHLRNIMSSSQKIAFYESMSPFLKPVGFTVFAAIELIKVAAYSAASDDTKMPEIMVRDEATGALTVNLKDVDAAQMRRAAAAAVDECRSLQENLMLGLRCRIDLSQISECHTNEQRGYSFSASTTTLGQKKANRAMIAHILSNNELRERFVRRIDPETNTIEWKHEELKLYLQKYDQFVSAFLFLVHFTSGMPGRAPEIASYRRINGKKKFRSILYHDGQVFFLPSKSKTSWRTGRNKLIARFLNPDASMIAIADHLIIRPFVIVVASALGRNEGSVYCHCLFVRNGLPMDGDAIRRSININLHRHLLVRITFREFRQILIYYARSEGFQTGLAEDEDENDIDYESEEEGQMSIFAEQAGHSLKAQDKSYGHFSKELRKVRERLLMEFRRASAFWHRFLGLPVHHTAQIPPAPNHQAIAPPLPNITGLPQDSSILLPDYFIEKNMQSARRDNPFEALYAKKECSENALLLLRALFNDNNATFKSAEQRLAVETTLYTDVDLLYQAGTGSGKSILFFLPAIEYFDMTSVVIVPTVSLKENLYERALGHGINACADHTKFTRQALLIVVANAVEDCGFMELLFQLKINNKLFKIFVDEVHCFPLARSYRIGYQMLPQLRALRVPIVATTATLSQESLNVVTKELLQEGFRVIKCPCWRPNIRYEMKQSDDLLDDTVNTAIHLTARLLPSERGIVFVSKVAEVDVVANAIASEGVQVSRYHGQWADLESRSLEARAWYAGEKKLMVATSAFGMGIDVPGVRFVIHFGLPYSLEDYMQETGRAGRDGKPALAITFFSIGIESSRLNWIGNQ